MKRPGLFFAAICLALAGGIALPAAASNAAPRLFDRRGGLPAIQAVVGRTIDSAAQDPRTSRSFKDIKLDALKDSVATQLCEASGGPCKYEGESMVKAHKGLDITAGEFDAFALHLIAALDYYKVGAVEKDELLQLLGPMKSDIVGK